MFRSKLFSKTVFVAALSLLMFTVTIQPGGAREVGEADPISWDQSKELLLYGTVTNDRGVEYDILTVPGYLNAALDVGGGARGMTSAVGEYADPKIYREIGSDIQDGNRDVKEGLVNHAVKESVEECEEDFNRTGEMRRKGVVGQWANYFWAVANLPLSTAECVYESTGNIVAGSTQATASAAYNYGVVPAARLGKPAVRAGYKLAWRGTAMSVGKLAWQNTFGNAAILIGGNEPTRHNADGFWVSREGPTVWDIVGLK